ncbi:Hypothetical protein D9617_3g019790 [Elsinoe fawcettii]|nr:Hypothetical protein D9617_3g019790 [Elsinoe fawcettii]
MASAVPAAMPQEIDFVALAATVPDISYSTAAATASAQIVSYNPSAVLSSAVAQITDTKTVAVAVKSATLQKRAACDAQPTGVTGFPYSPDTPSAFKTNALFASAASAAPVPTGYSQSFANRNGSNNAYGYLGYTRLSTYDTTSCAARCTAIFGCQSFNIYFERDPSQAPGTGCTNPPSVTYIKCVFWGGPLNVENANNYGQFRSQFQVVVAGSNAYQNNAILTPVGYSNPLFLSNAAINAPYDSEGADTYMGVTIFTSGPFNSQLCADACSMKSAYNLAHPPADGPVQTCQFFNTYILYVNDSTHLQGQVCSMYSSSWPANLATNKGQNRGGDRYLLTNSYAFTNGSNPGAKPDKPLAVYQARKAITFSSLQPFCSTLLGYSGGPSPSTTTSAATTPSTTPRTTTSILERRQPAAVGMLKHNYAETNTDNRYAPITVARHLQKRATSTISTTPTSPTGPTTPAGLTRFPATVLSSACSLAVTSPTSSTTSPLRTTPSPTATPAPRTCINSPPSFYGAGDCRCQYNQVCGQRYLGDAQRTYASVRDYGYCEYLCDIFDNCFVFDFQRSTGTCRLFRDRVAGGTVLDAGFDSGSFAGSCAEFLPGCVPL